MYKVFLCCLVLVISLTSLAAAADKVVVIPLNTGSAKDRVWGEGRRNAGLLTHDTASGYCTSSTGVNSAISFQMETWGAAASACPSGTWVCRAEDLPASGACSLNLTSTYIYFTCGGTRYPIDMAGQTELSAWVADSSEVIPGHGEVYYSGTLGVLNAWYTCTTMHVWCCWQ